MTLKYSFPVVHFYGDDPEDCEITYCTGKITSIHETPAFSDVVIETHDCGFHVIFGEYQNGWYLCIPSIMYGCELSDPIDVLYNIESMMRKTTELIYEDATAIAYGIAALQKQIL